MTGPNEDNADDAFLDALFDEARAASPAPSELLLSQIASDAGDLQIAKAVVTPPAGPPLLSRLRDALGGWAGLGGLATATVAGFYIGFAQPAALTLGMTTDNMVDVADVTDWTDSAFWPLDELAFEEG